MTSRCPLGRAVHQPLDGCRRVTPFCGFVWSTPWTIAGGRLGFDAAAPVAQVSIDKPVGLNKAGWADPLVEASLAKWDLGHHSTSASTRACICR